MAHENVIEMRILPRCLVNLCNDKINLQLRKGEIHALLGENGAGNHSDEYAGRTSEPTVVKLW